MNTTCGEVKKICLTPEEIKAFRTLYFQHYQVSLTDEQTAFIGERLVRLLEVVAKPIPKVDSGVSKLQNENYSDAK